MYIKCNKLLNIAPQQFYETKELFLDGAVKLLSLVAKSRTLSVDVKSNELKVNYTVNVRAIYLTEDGVVECKEESFDGSNVVKDVFGAEATAFVKTSVLGVEHHGVEKIKVRVLLEQKGVVLENCGFESLDSEGVTAKYTTTQTLKMSPIREGEFMVSGNVKTQGNVGKVLSTDVSICVKSVSCATDIIEIEGIANVSINYLDAGEIKGMNSSFNFKQELLSEGVSGEENARIFLVPITEVVTVEELENESNLNIEVVLAQSGYTTKLEDISYPVDAYSKEQELRLSIQSVTLQEEGCSIAERERFNVTVPLEEADDCVDIISIGTPWVGAVNLSSTDGLNVEGIICAEMLLKRENGECFRMLAEIPYSYVLPNDDSCSKGLVATVEVNSFNARLRFGSSLEVSGDLSINVAGTNEKEIHYVEKCDFLGEWEKSDAVISLYLVGDGETLFDCAKALHSDEEELMALNPELSLPLKAGDKVLLYRPF